MVLFAVSRSALTRLARASNAASSAILAVPRCSAVDSCSHPFRWRNRARPITASSVALAFAARLAMRSVSRSLSLVATLSLLLAAAILSSSSVEAVDRNKFRTCKQTDFCKRLRNENGHQTMNYAAEEAGVSYESSTGTVSLSLTSGRFPGQPALAASLVILNDGVVRFTVSETAGKYPRHAVRDVIQEAAVRPFTGAIQFAKHADKAEATWSMQGRGDSYKPQHGAPASTAATAAATHTNKLIINYKPFHLTFSVDDTVVMLVNSDNLLHFEQYRDRNPQGAAPPTVPHAPVGMEQFTPEEQADAQALYQLQLEQYNTEKVAYDAAVTVAVWPHDTAGAWEESHNGHTDHKQKGPAAIGLDVTFVDSKFVYGIPEHASSFALKNTIQAAGGSDAEYREPYRLYNLDVFEFELNEPMALYGAVPYVASHTQDGQRSAGMLWLNAAETYVDISETGGSSLFSSATPKKHVHWMSETGRLDAFFILGPKPSDLFLQYTTLTGFPFLPPQFSIAYHQCRWNYKSSDDVLSVDAGFDEHDIPYDVIWLDIEHTDAKKYFTWDHSSFQQPADMQRKLSDKGRRLVTIVDPHIKRDSAYRVHQEATSLGHYIKKKDGNDFDGWCWPGSSSWPDFFQQKVRDFWSTHFRYESYEGSTPSLFVWNDMNEPSVFNGPEVTMPKDNLHTLDGIAEKVEHRDVHNQYGMYVHMATNQGLIDRDANRQRPFVLTRAFFAGSQRSAAVWTGDNMARWDHLKSAQPMLLNLAVGQIPFSGADVGGFFGDPDAQLLTRWYQTGAFHPFFRAHAHIDAKRREPWLFGEPYTSIIRAAIRTRYAYLPYLYTLFYLNSINGMPILRPLWVEFPADPKTFGLEDQFLLGPSLLIRPVVEPDVTTQLVYLPAGPTGVQEVWYDLQNDARYNGGETVNVLTPLQHIPVFQRGGSIIAKRERSRRSSTLMVHDPYTLVIALSQHQTASGDLFVDDTNSFKYQTGGFIFATFSLTEGGLLSGSVPAANVDFIDANTIERIVIIGGGSVYTQATIVNGVDAQGRPVNNVPLTVQAANGGKRLVLRKPDVRIGSNWQIQLQ